MNFINTTKQGNCIMRTFTSITCRDHVATYICNAHASLFDIVFKRLMIVYLQGNIENRVVAYAKGPINFPLIKYEGTIYEKYIRDLASILLQKKASTFTKDNSVELKNLIQVLHQIETSEFCEKLHDKEECQLYVYSEPTNYSMNYADLPNVFKFLLYDIEASNIVQERNGVSEIKAAQIPYLKFTKDQNRITMSTTNTHILALYKEASNRDYIEHFATPLILFGSQTYKEVQDDISQYSYVRLAKC